MAKTKGLSHGQANILVAMMNGATLELHHGFRSEPDCWHVSRVFGKVSGRSASGLLTRKLIRPLPYEMQQAFKTKYEITDDGRHELETYQKEQTANE